MKSLNEYLEKNKLIIEEALKIDNNKFAIKYNYKDIFLKDNLDIKFEKFKTYLIIYEGEPEITKYLCDEAIKNKCNLILTIDDYFLAVNTIISGIAMKKIKEEKLNLFIKVYNNVEENKLSLSSKQVFKTIYIGEKEKFNYIDNLIKRKN